MADFWDQTSSSGKFPFLLETHNCLEICVNCVPKCVTAKIYPMKVQILQTFFLSNFMYNFSHVSTSLTPHFYSKLQNVYELVYLASQIVKCQIGRRSNFYMVKWTLIYLKDQHILKGLGNNWKNHSNIFWAWRHRPVSSFSRCNRATPSSVKNRYTI